MTSVVPIESDVTLGSYQVLDRWAKMMGVMTNQNKATSQAVGMLLMGVDLAIDNIRKCITPRPNEEKAKKRPKQLHGLQEVGIMESAWAQKFAGRFQFAGSSAHNDVGRSWIRGSMRKQPTQ